MNVPLLIAGRLRAWMMPIAIVAVVAITITFLVVPVRTFFAQRDLLETRGNQYGAYEEVNDALQDEVDALRLPAGVRAAIRSQLGYLLPDERRVPLLALPEAPVTLPARWPYTLVAGIVQLRESQRAGVEQGNLDNYDPSRP